MAKNIIKRSTFNILMNQFKDRKNVISMEEDVINNPDKEILLSANKKIDSDYDPTKNVLDKKVLLAFLTLAKDYKSLEMLQGVVNNYPDNIDIKLTLTGDELHFQEYINN